MWAKEGWFEWETDGWPFWSHHHHLSTWWAIRELPNVLFVHFGDLKADPETEMRRIAEFCAIDVSEDSWPALLATVGLDAMRDEARHFDDPMTMVWKGGADSFFYKGDSGRWRGVLTPDDLALYETSASDSRSGASTVARRRAPCSRDQSVRTDRGCPKRREKDGNSLCLSLTPCGVRDRVCSWQYRSLDALLRWRPG